MWSPCLRTPETLRDPLQRKAGKNLRCLDSSSDKVGTGWGTARASGDVKFTCSVRRTARPVSPPPLCPGPPQGAPIPPNLGGRVVLIGFSPSPLPPRSSVTWSGNGFLSYPALCLLPSPRWSPTRSCWVPIPTSCTHAMLCTSAWVSVGCVWGWV
jgi:hypothetical protein